MTGLRAVIDILKQIGCPAIYIDGSFVTAKIEPSDWDACIDCTPQHITELFKLYPFADIDEQKRRYYGELYYAGSEADAYGTTYLDYFQQIVSGSIERKGIVRIKLSKK